MFSFLSGDVIILHGWKFDFVLVLEVLVFECLRLYRFLSFPPFFFFLKTSHTPFLSQQAQVTVIFYKLRWLRNV
jgi:hypothetical protein